MMTVADHMLSTLLMVVAESLEAAAADERPSRSHHFLLSVLMSVFLADLLRRLLSLVPRDLVQILEVLEYALLLIKL